MQASVWKVTPQVKYLGVYIRKGQPLCDNYHLVWKIVPAEFFPVCRLSIPKETAIAVYGDETMQTAVTRDRRICAQIVIIDT